MNQAQSVARVKRVDWVSAAFCVCMLVLGLAAFALLFAGLVFVPEVAVTGQLGLAIVVAFDLAL